ncbi:glycosyltransferase family 4 protein [candidate division KSB1 bacterium]|nr:glycosyltransferase family 4 protein [candidate division KSB1 bacterium]
MKKILVLSYYFPPMGMAGTQRVVKFVKYLPEFGWQPTVLTVLPVTYWANDETLQDEIKNIKVIRTESHDPQRVLHRIAGQRKQERSVAPGKVGVLQKINRRVLPYLIIPDSKILWKRFAVKAAGALLRQESFDAVLTTSPPHSVHLIGAAIAKKHSLKWIADFRDAWSGGVVVNEPTVVQKFLNKFLQKIVVNRADAVSSVTPGIHRALKSCSGDSSKFFLLPNGYDEADFPKPQRKNKNRFVICHCGSITEFSHPDALLKALNIFKLKYPDLVGKICFDFVGYDTLGDFTQKIKQYGFDFFNYAGYLPHRDALQHLVNADGLLLTAVWNKKADFIPGKIYEYMGAQKPIFAITNIPDTIDMLKNTNKSTIVDPADFGGIADALYKFINRSWQDAEPDILIDKFTRKAQTAKLAQILDKLIDQSME